MFRSALQAAAPGHEEADDLFEPDAISDDEPILALKDAPPGEPKDPKAAPEAGEHGPEAAADYESMKDTLLKTGQKVHSSEGFDFYFWRGDNPGEKNLFAMPLTKRRRVTKGSIVCQITGGKCEAIPEPFDGPDQHVEPRKADQSLLQGRNHKHWCDHRKQCQSRHHLWQRKVEPFAHHPQKMPWRLWRSYALLLVT